MREKQTIDTGAHVSKSTLGVGQTRDTMLFRQMGGAMPVHHARTYDGHIIFIEASRGPDERYRSAFSIRPIKAGSSVVHQVAATHDMTFDSAEHAMASAFINARRWIDDGHRC